MTAYLAPAEPLRPKTTPDVPHDFYTAVNLLLRSMLQDPEFLYRIEIGTPTAEPGVFTLDELRDRLAALVPTRGAAPRTTRCSIGAKADALAGSLPERRTEAARLWATRARAISSIASTRCGSATAPSRRRAELTAAFNLETTKLIDRVVFDQPSSYLDLFTSRRNVRQRHAGRRNTACPAPAGGEGWVAYGDGGRAGILSHGSVLAAFSKFSDTSPTQRGIFVQTRLLCNEGRARRRPT